MPKLVIKQDLPEPSLQDKLEGWLRTFLPLLFLLMIAATAVALYFSQRPLAITRLADPALPRPPALVQPAVEPVVTETVAAPTVQAAAETTGAAEPPAGLPADFCPLFGPGAAECKAGAGKQ